MKHRCFVCVWLSLIVSTCLYLSLHIICGLIFQKSPALLDPSSTPTISSNRANAINIFEDITLLPPFPIDVVYTFAGEMTSGGVRIRYNGELRYSLRSIYKYMPWVHAIYIIVSDTTLYPSWIIKHKTSPQHSSIPLYIIPHSQIYANRDNALDNHNSCSIESRIHHITNLSQHYIYFNDDCFMFRNTSYLFFFSHQGTPRFPEGSIFPHYNKKNGHSAAAFRAVYSKANQKRLNISYKVPYRVEKFRTYSSLQEHMPKSYTKASVFELESAYPEWFAFVESHKSRFKSALPDGKHHITPHDDDLYIIITSYRVLRYHMLNNSTLQSEIERFDDELFAFVNKRVFAVDLFAGGYKRKDIHGWLTGGKRFNVSHLQSFANQLIQNRPHTFCMNDVFSKDIKSTVYAAEIQRVHRFYRKYLNEAIPFERENFIEPSLRDILVDLELDPDAESEQETEKEEKKEQYLVI